MRKIKIAVVNVSSVVTESHDVQRVVDALQIQVRRDFAPVWGVYADLRIATPKESLRAGEWLLVILDDADQAGVLGYHDFTKDGFPLGKVFAASDRQYGDKWSVTASHELLEMLVDPNINIMVSERSSNGARLYAYEICDACEGDCYGYKIGGVLVSDFVYPAWFESFRAAKSTQFDHRKKIAKPFQLLKGGYIGYCDIDPGAGWKQLTAEKHNFRARPPVGSRRERRTIPMVQRLRSVQ
jgi:hypothetical protein